MEMKNIIGKVICTGKNVISKVGPVVKTVGGLGLAAAAIYVGAKRIKKHGAQDEIVEDELADLEPIDETNE